MVYYKRTLYEPTNHETRHIFQCSETKPYVTSTHHLLREKLTSSMLSPMGYKLGRAKLAVCACLCVSERKAGGCVQISHKTLLALLGPSDYAIKIT